MNTTNHSSCDIHLIYAGGTFGAYGNPLLPLAPDLFLPILTQQFQAKNYHVNILDNTLVKDSSCLTPSDFVHFYQHIYHAHYHQHAKRFILITGTDTLAFLAAFLALACQALPISLVITGSMTPLLHPTQTPYTLNTTSDAWCNLENALTFLMQNKTGVFVSFAQKIMWASSVQKIHSSNHDAFAGITFDQPLISNLAKDNISLTPIAPHQLASSPTIHTLYCTPNHADDLAQALETFIPLTPTAAIIIGYGAGNLPQSDRLVKAIQALIAQDFLVIMASSCIFGARSNAYAAGAWQYALGVLPSGDLPLPAIYAQALWLCLSLPIKARQAAWQDSLANITPSTP